MQSGETVSYYGDASVMFVLCRDEHNNKTPTSSTCPFKYNSNQLEFTWEMNYILLACLHTTFDQTSSGESRR